MNKKLETTKLAVFEDKAIRKTWFNNEWWFVINDIIAALADSINPSDYFKKMKRRDKELAKLLIQGGGQIVPPLMLEVITAGGKQKMYCWHTEGIFRLVQSIPSSKAEPFKMCLHRLAKSALMKSKTQSLLKNA